MKSRLNRCWFRLTASFRGRRLDRDVDDEVAFHLEMRAADAVAAGESPAAARRNARRRFGSVVAVKEQMRELSTFTTLESVWQDAGYAVRTLRRQPGFTRWSCWCWPRRSA